MLDHLTIAILSEALYGGEISEREFTTQCHLAGIPDDRAREVIERLKEHDGVLNNA